MLNNRVVIVGSGLGGLSCGVVLAKNGYQVTVLEQSSQVGGCLQCFMRKGVKFETGMHFIGSASEGQTLDRLFRYLEIKDDIYLSHLDKRGYDVISLSGCQFPFANGKDLFVEQLSQFFPRQKDNLVKYFDLVRSVASASSLHSLKDAESDALLNTKYQLLPINSVIDSIISDPFLAKVLVGNLPLYAAEKDKTPFSTHAFIMDFYNQSAYRVIGGSDQIANALCKTIEYYGGEVCVQKKVTQIKCNNTQAEGVVVNNEDYIPVDFIISDTHPQRTLDLLDTKLIRPAFRQRINSMPQTIGAFSVYLHFKDNSVPYMNYNYYAYNGDTPWGCEDYDDKSWPKGFLYMHFCQEKVPVFAKTGVILSYLKMKDVEEWIGTSVGRRGEGYDLFKRRKAEKLLDLLERHFQGIRNKIENYYTSTPLTYYNYTGTECGSMYGVAKDVKLGVACRVPHKTKIPNVFQTGQNINSHGALGVLVGSIVTCSEFIPANIIYEQIVKSSI